MNNSPLLAQLAPREINSSAWAAETQGFFPFYSRRPTPLRSQSSGRTLQHDDRQEGDGATFVRRITCRHRADDTFHKRTPQASRLRRQLSVSPAQFASIERLGESAFKDPLLVTPRVIIDGYAQGMKTV